MSEPNGKGFSCNLLSLLYDNLHPGETLALPAHTNQANRNNLYVLIWWEGPCVVTRSLEHICLAFYHMKDACRVSFLEDPTLLSSDFITY